MQWRWENRALQDHDKRGHKSGSSADQKRFPPGVAWGVEPSYGEQGEYSRQKEEHVQKSQNQLKEFQKPRDILWSHRLSHQQVWRLHGRSLLIQAEKKSYSLRSFCCPGRTDWQAPGQWGLCFIHRGSRRPLAFLHREGAQHLLHILNSLTHERIPIFF